MLNDNENDEDLMMIYELVDCVPLSRPKKNIARDFSDGVLMAEIIKHFAPKLIEVHNYITTNNSKQKENNWNTLNRKVFKKIGLQISSKDIENIINLTPGFVESLLRKVFENVKINEIIL